MNNFNVIDTKGVDRELTTEQLSIIKSFTDKYDVDGVMYLNKICIVVFHADFKACYVYPDGTVTDSIILDV